MESWVSKESCPQKNVFEVIIILRRESRQETVMACINVIQIIFTFKFTWNKYHRKNQQKILQDSTIVDHYFSSLHDSMWSGRNQIWGWVWVWPAYFLPADDLSGRYDLIIMMPGSFLPRGCSEKKSLKKGGSPKSNFLDAKIHAEGVKMGLKF